HRFPIYRKPPDLLDIRLDSVYPELKDKRLRGRLIDDTVVPYFSRAELDAGQSPLAGNEILWVDDPIALFFLHIQGSGRVQLTDGSIVAVGYADQNGHPYRSIGRRLIEMGALERDEVTMFSIRDWLRENPARATELLNSNPSYVFFTLRDNPDQGPIGSMNVPLTAERSVAIDPRVIPLGTPLWLDTTVPGKDEVPYRRLVVAQDTGGAIKGTLRADLFWGRGRQAETMAGRMKQQGRIYILTPKPPSGKTD
ncbi:MAG: MltA domain-containing protein, partial [Gammaproteobacteria bacterium]|nr:MltA domain-containing protein [Gammaproteobacteria bacterium]